MEHFYKSIEGWFDFEDIYFEQVQYAESGFHFLEVGAWKGKSTAFMAVEIINSGKNISFTVVDTWLGSAEQQEDEAVKQGNLYAIFQDNLKSVLDYLIVLRMTSAMAATLFSRDSLDFVFIDASHDFSSVMLDLQYWYPKVKLGGMIAGHDAGLAPVQNALHWFFAESWKQSGRSWFYQKMR